MDTTLARLLGFPPERAGVDDTGGGIEVLRLIRNDGKVIGVTEEAIVLYPSAEIDPTTAEVALILDGLADTKGVTLTEYTGPRNGWGKKEAEEIAKAFGGGTVAVKNRFIVAVKVRATKSNVLEVSIEQPFEGVALISRYGIAVYESLEEADYEFAESDAFIEFGQV